MDNIDLLLLVLLGGGVGLLVVAAVVKYFMDYYNEVKYIKMEMHRSYSWDEYVHWRRELRTLRWCLIPGLTPDRVERIRARFSRGKHIRKENKKDDGFISMILPSILGICLCAVCLAGGTFAWFSATQNVATQTIVAADYSVSVEIKGTDTEVLPENGVYSLSKDTTYSVTLSAQGTAENGYAILRYGKLTGDAPVYSEAHTQAIAVGMPITVQVAPDADCELKIIAQWGKSSQGDNCLKAYDEETKNVYPLTSPAAVEKKPEGTESVMDETQGETDTPPVVTDPATTEDTTPPSTTEPEDTLNPTEYTVKKGDTLDGISKLYGISKERLIAYNDIENPSLIYAGQIIKIPPADWKIPETTTEETTPPTITEPEAPETEPTDTEQSETTTDDTEIPTTTTVPQDTTGTDENASESDGNE